MSPPSPRLVSRRTTPKLVWCGSALHTALSTAPTDRPFPFILSVLHFSYVGSGRNGVLELDFAIDRDGRVAAAHAERYRQLGRWIRRCYGHALPARLRTPTAPAADGAWEYVLTLTTASAAAKDADADAADNVDADAAAADADTNGNADGAGSTTSPREAGGATATVDRLVLRENLTHGERVRRFTVVTAGNATVANGTSVGNRRVVLFDSELGAVGALAVRFWTSGGADMPPVLSSVAAFKPCPSA